jgi:hypothetical protein
MGQTAEELRRQLEQQREVVGRDLVAIGDRVSPGRMVERRRAAVRESFGRARTAVMGAADGATTATSSRVGGVAEGVTSSAAAAASSVGGAVTAAPEALRSSTQGNPFAAGLVALGAGALLGSLLPKTRYEEQAVQHVQPALESAAAELGHEAQTMAEGLQEQAGEAAERLKESAQEATDAVKGDVADATEAVKRDASQAAEDTKASAQSAVEAAKPT